MSTSSRTPSLAIAPASLHQLRRRLLSAGTGVAADILQDAGFATGDGLFRQWQTLVVERTGVVDPGALDSIWFGSLLCELLESLGWGSLSTTPIGDEALLMSAANWMEAEVNASEHPGCYFTCGALAAFLTAQAGAPMAVLEVECRSCGDSQCRFLAGSAKTLAVVYDMMSAGAPWREAFGSPES